MYKKNQQIYNNKKAQDKKNNLLTIQKNIESMKQAAKQLTKKGQDYQLPPLVQARHYLYHQYLKDSSRSNDYNASQLSPNMYYSQEIYSRMNAEIKKMKPNKIIEPFSQSIKFKNKQTVQKEHHHQHFDTNNQIFVNSDQKISNSQEPSHHLKLNNSQIQRSQHYDKLFQTIESNRYEDTENKINSIQKLGKIEIIGKSQQHSPNKIQKIVPSIKIDFKLKQKHVLARKNTSTQQLLQNIQTQTLQPQLFQRQTPNYLKKHKIANEALSNLSLDYLNPETRRAKNKKIQSERKQRLYELNVQSKSYVKKDKLQAEFLSSRYNFSKQRSFKQYFSLMKQSIQQSIRRRKQIEKIHSKVAQSLPDYEQQKQLLSQQKQHKQIKIKRVKRKDTSNYLFNTNLQKNKQKQQTIYEYSPWDAKDNAIVDQFNINQNILN